MTSVDTCKNPYHYHPMLGEDIYRRESDTEISQQVSLSVAEANGTDRTSFSNVAIESAATETFAASTLPTALGAVATLRISDTSYVGRTYHTN